MITPDGTSTPPVIAGLTYVEPLGSGGYADVHLYQQQLPERPVAVKVLRSTGLNDRLREQFTAEANAMARLADHPNIVSVFSASITDDGRPYLVMSYYPNANLGVRAAQIGLSVSEVLQIGVQIASAVETAHRAGILHRDIKPANILTNQYDAPGLTDFGIAATAMAVAADADTGVSVPWSPPEVLYVTGPATARSDVYSLGTTLWHLLVGRSPFEVPGGDNSAFALMPRIRDLPPPSCPRADVPDALDRVLRQAMAKRPDQRPATALQLARNLQGVERGLRLTQTSVVLPSVVGRNTRDTTDSGPAATRVRSPARIDAQGESVPTGPRPVRPAASVPVGHRRGPVQPTVHRPSAPEPEPRADEVPSVRRRLWPAVLVASAVAAVAVVVGVTLMTGGSKPVPGTPSSGGTNQDAGALGENEPPGTPTVTATRTGTGTVRFTWIYSARLVNDTYTWQTADRKLSGVVKAPALDLPDPPGVQLCVQVKVVRADGGNAATDWSPAGCGS